MKHVRPKVGDIVYVKARVACLNEHEFAVGIDFSNIGLTSEQPNGLPVALLVPDIAVYAVDDEDGAKAA